MITLRRAGERAYTCHRRRDVWQSLPRRGEADDDVQGFGGLDALDELRLPPGSVVPVRRQPAEVVTYVREGALTCTDAHGAVRRVLAGDFQRRASAWRARYTEANTSSSEWAHVFQLWLRPEYPSAEAAVTERRFTSGDRRGDLYVVASPDGRARSAQLTTRAHVASALLRRGQHIVHMLEARHSAWLHIVVGTVALGELTLTTGDGVAVVDERALSLTARDDCELLLVDLYPPAPGSSLR